MTIQDYSGLYKFIVSELNENKSNRLLYVARALLLLTSINLVGVLFFTSINLGFQFINNPMKTIVYGFLVTTTLIVIPLIIITGFEVAILGTSDPFKNSTRLAVQLLTIVPSIRRKDYGLSFFEINQLRSVAEIEQSSADWRGNFTQTILIGFFVFLFTAIQSRELINYIESFILLENIDIQRQSLSDESFVGGIIASVIWGLFGVAVYVISIRFLANFRMFLGTESANRTILLACHDASSLLTSENLEGKEFLSLKDKDHLARIMGYRFVKCLDPSLLKNATFIISEQEFHALISTSDFLESLES